MDYLFWNCLVVEITFFSNTVYVFQSNCWEPYVLGTHFMYNIGHIRFKETSRTIFCCRWKWKGKLWICDKTATGLSVAETVLAQLFFCNRAFYSAPLLHEPGTVSFSTLNAQVRCFLSGFFSVDLQRVGFKFFEATISKYSLITTCVYTIFPFCSVASAQWQKS